MKKVSVFTVLTCFLAGAAHFPCYAGNLFGKPEQTDDDRSKGGPSQPSKSGGQALPKTGKPDDSSKGLPVQPKQSSSGSMPSAHPKPTPSPSVSPLDPVVDSGALELDFLAKAPVTFDPPSDLEGQHPEGPNMVEQIADSVRKTLGPDVIVNVYLNPPPPSSDQSLSSFTPSSLPAPLFEKEDSRDPLGDSYPLAQGSSQIHSVYHHLQPPLSDTSSQIPSMHPTSYPSQGHLQSPLPMSSSSTEDGKFHLVPAASHGKWVLSLPMSVKIRTEGRGKLALLPKICALYIYPYLSDVNHPDCLSLNKSKSVSEDQKVKALVLIERYLKEYGEQFVQTDTAAKLSECLRNAIESGNSIAAVLKVGHKPLEKKIIFSLQIPGGPVIFVKIPGQDL
ncbi:MAG: hypothetical protein K2X28_08630 [Alphaproteobacteria bacterium]|nr:hypothetical protein [Alphaproteobacteria bacterium]